MVQCCFTSTEAIRLIRTGSPWQPPQLSHSSWTLRARWSWGSPWYNCNGWLSVKHQVTEAGDRPVSKKQLFSTMDTWQSTFCPWKQRQRRLAASTQEKCWQWLWGLYIQEQPSTMATTTALLLHNNAAAHEQHLEGEKWQGLPRPPYSPDLIGPCGCWLFCLLWKMILQERFWVLRTEELARAVNSQLQAIPSLQCRRIVWKSLKVSLYVVSFLSYRITCISSGLPLVYVFVLYQRVVRLIWKYWTKYTKQK